VVDGRNRELACLVAGVRVEYADLPASTPEDKILAGVISANLKRRHLTTSQRAMVAAELATMKQGERTDLEPSANLQKVSRTDAAESLGVSVRSVAAAAKVKNDAPELVEPVRDGKLSVSTAARIAEYPQQVREEVAAAEDPKEAAHELLSETDNLDDEPTDEEPEPLGDTLPQPSIDASKKRPVPSWMTPGNKVDPNHPFANLLHKLSSVSGEITKLFKTDQGKILLQALSDVAKIPVKTRFVAYTSDLIENGELFSGKAKFVGFHALRDLVKKAGLAKKPLTAGWLRKTFLEVINASEDDILDAEGWK
jgi:hypothetical protein